MKKWIYTCEKFKDVRCLIDKGKENNEENREMLRLVADCCDEIAENLPKVSRELFAADFVSLGMEIREDIEMIEDEDEIEENEVVADGWLNDLYDLCNNARVWLGI